MSEPKPKMTKGHYWIMGNAEEPTIVEYYLNPDANAWGFGFNLAYGAGFLADDDLVEKSILIGPIDKPKVWFKVPDNPTQPGEKRYTRCPNCDATLIDNPPPQGDKVK